MSIQLSQSIDTKILEDLLNEEQFTTLRNYDVKFALFTKYAKRDKEGKIKSPALSKFGISIPAQVKIVSNFNRITDDVDVKIILNAEHWAELSKNEKKSVLENMIRYIEIKEDKEGEPMTISESCDKVQLKMRHPDFYCEGFLDQLCKYGQDYLPWRDAKAIADNIKNAAPQNPDEDQADDESKPAEPVEEKPKRARKVPQKAEKAAEDQLESIDVNDVLDEII